MLLRMGSFGMDSAVREINLTNGAFSDIRRIDRSAGPKKVSERKHNGKGRRCKFLLKDLQYRKEFRRRRRHLGGKFIALTGDKG